MEEEGTQNLKLLKVIVVTLGILIVGMLLLMVGIIIYRLTNAGDDGVAMEAPSAVTSELAVPEGGTLKDMTPTDRELYLHVEDASGGDHIYALDRKSGALLWHRQLIPAQ